MVAPARPIAQLLDLERRGLLDLTRLGGRPAHHVRLAFLAGAMWPWLLLAALLPAIDGVGYHSGIGIARFGGIAFLVMLDLAFVAFATSRSRAGDGWGVTSAFVLLAFGFYAGLGLAVALSAAAVLHSRPRKFRP